MSLRMSEISFLNQGKEKMNEARNADFVVPPATRRRQSIRSVRTQSVPSDSVGTARIMRSMEQLLRDAYDVLVKAMEGVEMDPRYVDRLCNDIWDVLNIDGRTDES